MYFFYYNYLLILILKIHILYTRMLAKNIRIVWFICVVKLFKYSLYNNILSIKWTVWLFNFKK